MKYMKLIPPSTGMICPLTLGMMSRGHRGRWRGLISDALSQVSKKLLLFGLPSKAEVADLSLETHEQLGQIVIELNKNKCMLMVIVKL